MTPERLSTVRVLEVIRSSGLSPARDVALQRHLLQQVRRGREPGAVLHLGWIEGDALALGRYQRARSALAPNALEPAHEILRRPTGGRTSHVRSGQLSLSLALSNPSALLPPGSGPIGPDKVINRYVRGLLAGLHALGLKAYFFGRDFLSLNRRHGGHLSFEVGPEGETLFHALVAVDAATVPDPESLGYPGIGGNRPDPEPTTVLRELGRDVERSTFEDAIIQSYARQQGVPVRERSFSPLEHTLFDERSAAAHADLEELADGREEARDEAPWTHSGLKPIACGYLEVSVQVVQRRFLGGVRLFGDFMSNSAAIAGLERSLRLVPLDWREIGQVVDRTFAGGSNVIVGVRYLRVIPDAVVDAAQAAGVPSGPGPSDL